MKKIILLCLILGAACKNQSTSEQFRSRHSPYPPSKPGEKFSGTGGVKILSTNIPIGSLSYEERKLLVKSGAQNVSLPELEKKRRDGAQLTTEKEELPNRAATSNTQDLK
jgi:hypothetical protein